MTPRQTFRLGETIKLDCPIRGTPTPIVEWYKVNISYALHFQLGIPSSRAPFFLTLQDGDSVTAGWERFKSTSHGLRIKEVILDDSGEYTCKGNFLKIICPLPTTANVVVFSGVNGFGSEQVTFEIVIVGKVTIFQFFSV